MRKIKEIFAKIDLNIITYGICVFIASALWFLNTLNKEYSTELSYPVKYTDLSPNKYLTNDPPQTITVEIRAKGFILLRHHISRAFFPPAINISTAGWMQDLRKKDGEYTLKINDIKDKISNQLNSAIKLINVYPDEIHFKFSTATSKRIKIEPTVNYRLKKGYILKDHILCKPDSITIHGSAKILDTIKVYTFPWQVGEINKSRSKTVRIAPVKNVNFGKNIKEVDIKIDVERFTEAQKSIPIVPINVPDSLNIRLFPAHVEVTYDVGLSRYDKITEKDFKFTAKYTAFKDVSYIEINAEVVPQFIQNLKFTPQRVEFILEKK